MPGPDSVTFNNETTENPKIQHKVERSSVRNEYQKSKKLLLPWKFPVWQWHPREKRHAWMAGIEPERLWLIQLRVIAIVGEGG